MGLDPCPQGLIQRPRTTMPGKPGRIAGADFQRWIHLDQAWFINAHIGRICIGHGFHMGRRQHLQPR